MSELDEAVFTLGPALADAHAALMGDSNDAEHDALVALVEAVECVHPSLHSRESRLRKLVSHFLIDEDERPDADHFALLREKDDDEVRLSTFATFAGACEWAAIGSQDGWQPRGIFDLDTGELICVEVHTEVKRAADQSHGTNPLAPDPKCKRCGEPLARHDEVDQRCPDD